MRKFNYLWLLMLINSSIALGQACSWTEIWGSSTLDLRTQEDIDNFSELVSGCSSLVVEGNLNIGYPWSSYTSDITDISALDIITEVGYGLKIRHLDLENLTGLNNLQTIGYGIDIYGNSVAQTIDLANNLVNLGEDIHIYNQVATTEINGFDAIQYIPALEINTIPNLTSITAFQNVENINGNLNIHHLDSFTGSFPFGNLNSAGRILLEALPNVESQRL